jgi:geranylgeranyl transferase type-1 subunit beta
MEEDNRICVDNEVLTDSLSLSLDAQSHVKYFQSMLRVMPEPYSSIDTSRMTAVYFAVTGLDVLNALETVDKQQVINFIYGLQLGSGESVTNKVKSASGQNGFIGGSFANHTICNMCNAISGLGNEPNTIENNETPCCALGCTTNHIFSAHEEFHQGHIAITYTSLVTLITLGDDLSGVKTKLIVDGKPSFNITLYRLNLLSLTNISTVNVVFFVLSGLKRLQSPDGSFRATFTESGESDVRFLYCACAISTLLNDWSGVNIEAATSFVLSCFTYEGGFGVTPSKCSRNCIYKILCIPIDFCGLLNSFTCSLIT